ncbi:MAG: hypothetical protein MT490_07620 [Sphingomonas sp.]|uniref:hypothetical protein n=1 Tax=Sphingomonas sp. TaxID=28214 RepID=UPI002275EC5F|nr:hypothetical protein [Sphingomonas sp.]MCX8475653.1 hypothetical protein [Sphingomonas sp.]
MAGIGQADRRFWGWLGAIVALGLGLRIAGAQGGLWLDEAWSALQARDAGTPLGVFLNINHDNNHHLNSLWLQFVGFGAPPPLARALSIASGTAAVLVAGLLGARRAPGLGLVTALLFAVSPAMVTMGSEARGYATMSLALLLAILVVDRWLAGEASERAPRQLAWCFFLGAFAQLTMFFGFCAVAGWVFFALWQRGALRTAIVGTLRLLWPSVLALALVVAVILGAAAARTGFKFGAYEPFTLLQFLHGVSEMFEYAIGFPIVSLWWFALIPALVIVARGWGVRRMALHRLAIIGFPLTLALLHAGNVGHPRYYLVAGIALLVLAAEMLWLGFVAGGWKRWAAGGALALILTGSIVQDVDLAINRRGDPAAAVRAMQARAPAGARILLNRDTGLAMLEVAAAHARYPLAITLDECPPARFLLIDRYKGEQEPPRLERCGAHYTPIAERRAHGMSGTHWTLYERQP